MFPIKRYLDPARRDYDLSRWCKLRCFTRSSRQKTRFGTAFPKRVYSEAPRTDRRYAPSPGFNDPMRHSAKANFAAAA